MRTVYANFTRRRIIVITSFVIILVFIIILISKEFDIYHKKFNIKYAVKLPDRFVQYIFYGIEKYQKRCNQNFSVKIKILVQNIFLWKISEFSVKNGNFY